jgi:hypothetical protein
LDEASEALRAALKASNEQAHAAMERMSEIERNALKSYNTIGNASVAGYHQTHADAEKKQANFLALGCCLRRGRRRDRRIGRVDHP